MLKIKIINLYNPYKIKPTSPKHNAIVIITKNNTGTNHSGAVTNHQDHVIYPVNLRTRSIIIMQLISLIGQMYYFHT